MSKVMLMTSYLLSNIHVLNEREIYGRFIVSEFPTYYNVPLLHAHIRIRLSITS
jgi:hypothetical protein